MTLPWRPTTTEDVSAEVDSRFETPGGAQDKVDYGINNLPFGSVGSEQIDPSLLKKMTPIAINAQFENLNTQVIDTQSNIAKSMVPMNYSGAVVTFIDDDGYTSSTSRWKPIADSKGIKIDLAINSAYLGQTDGKGTHLNLSELKGLYSQGFGILSHSSTHGDFNTYTPTQLDTELNVSLNWIVDNGFGKDENVLVYPFGITPDKVNIKNAVRKYFNYAISVNDNINPEIIDNMCVNRIHGDLRDLQGLKDAVDYANTKNTWLVILTHSWDNLYWSTSKITAIIDYIKSKGIPILTSNEAIKRKGNVAAFGEYTDTVNKSVYINRNGANNIGIKVVGDAFTYTSNSPINLFEQGKITVVPLFTTQDLFLGTGGVMEVHRIPPNDDFAYAIYKPATRNELWMNKWNTSTNTWNGWVKIAAPITMFVNNNVESTTMDAPIQFYDPDVETIIPIVNTKDTLLSIGGVMRVFRSSLQNFSYATYTPYNVNSFYMRKWVEGTNAWGSWEKTSV